jgi:hypothetical protein
MALIKELWTGEQEFLENLGCSAEQYVEQLKQRLSSAAAIAHENTESAQLEYSRQYNLRSKSKRFDVGDDVLVLLPDRQSKMLARWLRGEVIKCLPQNEYLVKLQTGSIRHLHANLLRRFIARVNAVCGAFSDGDDDFGEVPILPTVPDVVLDRVSDRIDASSLAHLSATERDQLLSLLDRYSDCFSERIGKTSLVEHQINLRPDFKPKLSRAYSIPEVIVPAVKQQLRKLLDDGVIRYSKSCQSSPLVVVVKKRDKNKPDVGPPEVRLTVDYRFLNGFILPDGMYSHVITDAKLKVGRGRYISVFDAKSSFFQIPIRESDKWLTAVITPIGLVEFNCVSMGLLNSSREWVRLIEMVLAPISDICVPYVDDIAVVTETSFEDHLVHIERFLAEIRKAKITLNLRKCEFIKPEVTFVGHIVGSGKHRPDPSRIEALKNLPRPRTKTQLRSVMGSFQFFRPYLPRLAEISKCLTDLTAKKMPSILRWEDRHEKAFSDLKQALCDVHCMHSPVLGRPYYLRCDSSDYAVGCSLGQLDECGTELPIAYASQKLTDVQKRWSVLEREAYACIWSLNKFRSLILFSKIHLFSDHRPLSFLTKATSGNNSKLIRWSLALQEFNLDFNYTPGKSNVVADMASRLVE